MGLMTTRRFAPFFWVQFLGAFNDNIFKIAMVVLLSYRVAGEAEAGLINTIAGGLFILPFFLFSAAAGQIGDKFEKSRIVRTIKMAEVAIMALGAIGFYTGINGILYATLFLMGTHSAFFGPVKYSILPQLLREDELMTGNGLFEMGTFLAILLGELLGGFLAGHKDAGMISGAVMGVAFSGYLVSRFVPEAKATSPDLELKWNPFTETKALWGITKQKESIFNSVLGISWFWYFGATLLTQLPIFAKHTLHGDESVVTLLLAVFSISIGAGSMLSAWLSRGDIELGIVPLGAAGMTIFAAQLYFLDYPPLAAGMPLMTWQTLVAESHAKWVLFDMSMIGVSSSLFIVPLYALLQYRSDESARSRLIAANNVFNSVFMIGSALVTMGMIAAGLGTLEILLVTAALNALVSLYIFTLIPEFALRFGFWIMASFIYRIRYEGRDIIPRNGSAVIVANHVSFIDWFILTATCRRPVRFVMDHNFFKLPVAGFLFRMAKAIPIAPAKEDNALKEKAFDDISAALRDDNIVCIFPEGKITKDGALNPFKPGVERILARDPVPVIPVAIEGLWGSFFSRFGGRAMARVPRPSLRRIGVKVGPPMAATTSAAAMEAAVEKLLGGRGPNQAA